MSSEYSGSTATVHLDDLKKNLDYLKIKSGVERVMAVVKANAYGHGAVPVARFLENHISRFAVATIDEGIELRNAGIGKPVLVFAVPDIGKADAYTRYKLTACISHTEHFDILKPGTRYQINFDTGMRRAGLSHRQSDEIADQVSRYSDLDCTGVFSHYTAADDPGSRFVEEQQEQFSHIRSFFTGFPAHMSNTAAVLHYVVNHFDMIRVGIGLTGYAPGKVQSENLIPVLDWSTRAVLVREIDKGDPVSYGGWWRAPESGYLATLPVGYADGVPRSLNNRLKVEIEGGMYPVVGSITMDFCMVFLGKKMISRGTEVRLMGNRGWRANEWAQHTDTITHEILSGLRRRICREYRT